MKINNTYLKLKPLCDDSENSISQLTLQNTSP